MNPVSDVKAVASGVLANLKPKHFVIGAIVFFGTSYVLSRFLPGAAVRAGILPRPMFPQYQIGLPEPFGLVPLKSYLKGAAPAGAQKSSAQMTSSTEDSLSAITGGSTSA